MASTSSSAAVRRGGGDQHPQVVPFKPPSLAPKKVPLPSEGVPVSKPIVTPKSPPLSLAKSPVDTPLVQVSEGSSSQTKVQTLHDTHSLSEGETTEVAPRTVVVAPSEEEANKSSAVPKGQMDAFVDALVTANPGFPLFTVSDNNSFHTSGYLWGLYAVKQLKKKNLDGPVAVVNFDSHQDAGKKASAFVASDRWGGVLVTALVEAGYPACYVSAFNRPKGSGSIVLAGGGAGPAPPGLVNLADLSKEGVRASFKTLWTAMRAYFEKDIQYVFFTIDRDVLFRSHTQWGDGAITGTANLLTLLKAALGPLGVVNGDVDDMVQVTRASLIGFDSTGLPEHPNLIPKPGGGLGEIATVWTDIDDEATQLHTLASTSLKLIQDMPNPLMFFSGSAPYARAFDVDPATWTCWKQVTYLTGKMPILTTKVWSYLLCLQKAPVFHHGWKKFSLYRPTTALRAVTNSNVVEKLGDATPVGGFSCTASVSSPGVVAPPKVKVKDMLEKTGPFADT